MKNSKMISLFLALTLLLSSLPLALTTAFAATSGDFEYNVLSDGTAEITKYNGEATDLVIPSQLDGYTVKSIGKIAFYGCESLKSVTVPNGVKSIGDSAFGYCTNIASISLPDSIFSMGSYVFNGTAFYENKANWENGVLYVGKHLLGDGGYFDRISGEYYVKNGTLTIAGSAFVWCEDLISITIPSSVKSIGEMAFGQCGALNSVYYKGTKTQWNSISFGSGNENLFKAGIYYSTLETPKITSLSITGSGIEIKWNQVAGAEKYRVYYKNSVETIWQEAGDTAATSYVWTGAKNGIEYYFTVRCISSDGKTYASSYDPAGKNIDYVAISNPTKAPATKAPTTATPATKAPATKAPVTKAPATKAPATKAPATSAPTTVSTTAEPTTVAPTTTTNAAPEQVTAEPTTDDLITELSTEAENKPAEGLEATGNPAPSPSTDPVIITAIAVVAVIGVSVVVLVIVKKKRAK